MTETILTPTVNGEAVDLSSDGLTYRKMVLRPAEINYEGRPIKFDEPYMAKLADSFAAGLRDQVPFVLATADNKHSEHAEDYRGEVIGLDLARPGEAKGLYANIRFPDKEAARSVAMNPKLGVSARLIQMDGRPVVKHVCGTLDPRVAGMGSWAPVSLSADEGDVIDLTSYTEGDDMSEQTTEVTTEDETSFEDLTTEEIDALLAEAVAELEAETVTETTEERELVTAELTDTEARAQIDLTNARVTEVANENRVLRDQLAAERWGRERDAYANDGVTPAILDLAAPLLELAESPVIDLTAGDGTESQINPQDIVRAMLEELSGSVDLSRPKGVDGQPVGPNGVDTNPQGLTAAEQAMVKQLDFL